MSDLKPKKSIFQSIKRHLERRKSLKKAQSLISQISTQSLPKPENLAHRWLSKVYKRSDQKSLDDMEMSTDTMISQIDAQKASQQSLEIHSHFNHSSHTLEPVAIPKKTDALASSLPDTTLSFNPRLRDLVSLELQPLDPKTLDAEEEIFILKPDTFDHPPDKSIQFKGSEVTLASTSFKSLTQSSMSLLLLKTSQLSLANVFSPRRSRVSPTLHRRATVSRSEGLNQPNLSFWKSGDTYRKSLSPDIELKKLATTQPSKRRHTLATVCNASDLETSVLNTNPSRRYTIGLKVDETIKKLCQDSEIQHRIQNSKAIAQKRREFVASVVRKPTKTRQRQLTVPEQRLDPLTGAPETPTDFFEHEHLLEQELERKRTTRKQKRAWSTDPSMEKSPEKYFGTWSLLGWMGPKGSLSIPTFAAGSGNVIAVSDAIEMASLS